MPNAKGPTLGPLEEDESWGCFEERVRTCFDGSKIGSIFKAFAECNPVKGVKNAKKCFEVDSDNEDKLVEMMKTEGKPGSDLRQVTDFINHVGEANLLMKEATSTSEVHGWIYKRKTATTRKIEDKLKFFFVMGRLKVELSKGSERRQQLLFEKRKLTER